MRLIWKGHFSFGLVDVPVTLYPAVHRSELHLHLIDSHSQARVR
jgi:DNA end-binding protein Ku